ncbi:hypothetical protein KUTeg_018276 [Tegillarca granosa]|uniref:Sodium channel protein n=1 Tax=Tegillarca granosa TaxID=220873 RepID=A0ABQ9EN84_TEGGR|nr:hypothetical protein KUTeg_018276 [Tegillarca granosa]
MLLKHYFVWLPGIQSERLKTIVGALIRAFKLLFEVIILIAFCLMIFSLFGMQFFVGILRNKCVATPPEYNSTASLSADAQYDAWVKNTSNWHMGEEDYTLCGNSSGAGICPDNYTCLEGLGENPRYGFVNYDHVGWSMLASFQLITLDFWEDQYNKIIRAYGPVSVLYFVMVVMFGSFYLINLMLAVVAMAYEMEAINAGKEKAEKARKKKKRESKEAKGALSAAKAAAKWKKDRGTDDRKSDASGDKSSKIGRDKASETKDNKKDSKTPGKTEPGKLTVDGQVLIKHGKGRNPMVKMASKDSGYSVQSQSSSQSGGSKHSEVDNISLDSQSNPKRADSGVGSINQGYTPDMMITDKTIARLRNPLNKQESSGNVSSSAIHIENQSHDDDLDSLASDKEPKKKSEHTVLIVQPEKDGSGDRKPGTVVDRNCACCFRNRTIYIPWLYVQNFFYIIVSDPLFDLFITLCIVINTILMASQHYDQSAELELTLKVSNYMRVFKLAQSWPTMKLLLSIILNTVGALGNLTVVLGIVIYIFAVIGLQLFREDYVPDKFDGEVPRWRFTDILHSLLMIFRILCGEWIEELWECMRASSEVCLVVFLPSLILGNFIVLNLFLALLLNAFAGDNLEKSKPTENEENKLLLAFVRLKNIFCCCCKRKKKQTSVEPDEIDEESAIGMTKVESFTKDSSTVKSIKSTESKEKEAKKVTIKDDPKKPNTPKVIANGTVTDKSKDGKDNKKQQVNGTIANKDSKRDKFSSFDAARKANETKTDKDDKEGAKNDDKEDADDLQLGDDAAAINDKKPVEGEEEEEKKKEIVVVDCLPQVCMKKCNCWDAFDASVHGKRWYLVRKVCVRIVEHKIFEGIILFLIGVSSLTLAFEDAYLYEKPELEQALSYMNLIFAVLFTIEMLLKWIANGFKVYFTNVWSLLDFFIVVISWASIIADAAGAADISAFRALRTLRALRPLRAISRWQGMKIVVNALMFAIPAIVNVLLVCLLFWLIFSIMGVQFFSGKFFWCQDDDGNKFKPSEIANKSQCLDNNHTWYHANVNFDNVGAGLLALLQVATFEGWMEAIEAAVDSTEIDQQPDFEASVASYLYFVCFIVFGAFFTLNLFIGVIIDNFNTLKKQYEGSPLDMFLTAGQKNYMTTLKKLSSRKPQKTIRRPNNACQSVFYDISTSQKFDIFIIFIIVCNMTTMAIEHYKQSDTVTEVLSILNIIFTTIFLLECIVKLVGLRLHYFRVGWNVFDFIIVVLSLIGFIVDDVLNADFISPTLLRVVRVFRIGRVLRLIKAAKGIRKLLFALIMSLPALLNIGVLLLLVMYIYAIIGMSSFQNLKITDPLDEIINFRTFANSFILLLRLSTSAGWNDILEPLLLDESDGCDPNYYTRPDGVKVQSSTGDCSQPALGVIFMVSYTLIVFLIVINMYIAVILENFNQAHEQEEIGITEDDFDGFYVVWEKYDPLATQFIKYEHLPSFVAELDPPLGIPKPNEIALVALDLPIVEGDKLHCLDVLIGLVKNVLGKVEETEEFKELKSQLDEKYAQEFPTRVNTNVNSSTMMKKKEDVAAKALQRAWRSWKTQKQLRNITKMAVESNQAAAAKNSKSKGGAILSLGRRLSSALTSFFSSSRPASAASRKSVNSLSPSPTDKTKLEIPSVKVLYANKNDKSDVEL